MVLTYSCRCCNQQLAVFADKVLTLPRDFTPVELPSALRVPWDLLLAANPEAVETGRGKQVSLTFSRFCLIAEIAEIAEI